MRRYGILNSRKRAIIALIHTIFFGLIALIQTLVRQHPTPLISVGPGKLSGPIALTAIYLLVSVVLLILLGYSRSSVERLYFALCTSSATIGLLRCLLGDPTTYVGNGIRVLLLGFAVITGTFIVKNHTQIQTQFAD
jgi:hypothetical protein